MEYSSQQSQIMGNIVAVAIWQAMPGLVLSAIFH